MWPSEACLLVAWIHGYVGASLLLLFLLSLFAFFLRLVLTNPVLDVTIELLVDKLGELYIRLKNMCERVAFN